MTVVRRRRDPRTREEVESDRRLLARFESRRALVVDEGDLEAAAARVARRNAERRREVARLGEKIADLRRSYGLTQEEVARAIGTSKTNVSALERGRAPGISLERFLAVVETIGRRARSGRRGGDAAGSWSPTAPVSGLTDCLGAA